MRQFAKVVVAALLVMALLVSAFGCAGDTPATPTQSAAPDQTTTADPTKDAAAAPTTAAQPEGDVIELKFHHHNPPQEYGAVNGLHKWAELIGEKTNGKVEVTVFPAETLGKAKDALDMTTNGIADIAWGYIGNHSGRFPNTDLMGLPMVGIQSSQHGSKVAMEMYRTTPEIQKEFEGMKVLFLHTVSPHSLGFATKKVETIEDLAGLRIRSVTGAPLKFLQALGATPVTVPMPEVFEALDKGTIDGYATDWMGIGGFKFDTITDYVLEEPLYVNTFYMVMNQKKWDSLPADVQTAIEEVSGDFGSQFISKVWDEGNSLNRQNALDNGVEILTMSDQERQRWVEIAPTVWEEYIQIVDGKGGDGEALVQKVRDLAEELK